MIRRNHRTISATKARKSTPQKDQEYINYMGLFFILFRLITMQASSSPIQNGSGPSFPLQSAPLPSGRPYGRSFHKTPCHGSRQSSYPLFSPPPALSSCPFLSFPFSLSLPTEHTSAHLTAGRDLPSCSGRFSLSLRQFTNHNFFKYLCFGLESQILCGSWRHCKNKTTETQRHREQKKEGGSCSLKKR